MRTARIAITVVLLSACSVTAGAFVLVVADPVNIAEHAVLNGWRATLYNVLTEEVLKIRQMAERLSAVVDLVTYVARDAPRWRTRVADGLPNTLGFMAALNGEQPADSGYAAVSRQPVDVGEVLTLLGEGPAENA